MDKLYLHNPNMAYVLSGEKPETGNARETIFYCWTKQKYETLESPVSDFEIDGKTFEVGGRKKGKKQIELRSVLHYLFTSIERHLIVSSFRRYLRT